MAPGPEDKLLLQNGFQLCLKYALPPRPVSLQEVEILVAAAPQELEIHQTSNCMCGRGLGEGG